MRIRMSGTGDKSMNDAQSGDEKVFATTAIPGYQRTPHNGRTIEAVTTECSKTDLPTQYCPVSRILRLSRPVELEPPLLVEFVVAVTTTNPNVRVSILHLKEGNVKQVTKLQHHEIQNRRIRFWTRKSGDFLAVIERNQCSEVDWYFMVKMDVDLPRYITFGVHVDHSYSNVDRDTVQVSQGDTVNFCRIKVRTGDRVDIFTDCRSVKKTIFHQHTLRLTVGPSTFFKGPTAITRLPEKSQKSLTISWEVMVNGNTKVSGTKLLQFKGSISGLPKFSGLALSSVLLYQRKKRNSKTSKDVIPCSSAEKDENGNGSGETASGESLQEPAKNPPETSEEPRAPSPIEKAPGSSEGQLITKVKSLHGSTVQLNRTIASKDEDFQVWTSFGEEDLPSEFFPISDSLHCKASNFVGLAKIAIILWASTADPHVHLYILHKNDGPNEEWKKSKRLRLCEIRNRTVEFETAHFSTFQIVVLRVKSIFLDFYIAGVRNYFHNGNFKFLFQVDDSFPIEDATIDPATTRPYRFYRQMVRFGTHVKFSVDCSSRACPEEFKMRGNKEIEFDVKETFLCGNITEAINPFMTNPPEAGEIIDLHWTTEIDGKKKHMQHPIVWPDPDGPEPTLKEDDAGQQPTNVEVHAPGGSVEIRTISASKNATATGSDMTTNRGVHMNSYVLINVVLIIIAVIVWHFLQTGPRFLNRV